MVNMEREAVRRRMSMIAGHFAGDDFHSGAAHVLLPLNCSSGLNPVVRCDNRMYFARQGSSCQGPFMRQQQPSTTSPPDTNSANKSTNCCSSCENNKPYILIESPLFSRPTLKCPSCGTISSSHSKIHPRVQPIVQDCSPAFQRPSFARPTKWLGLPEKYTSTIDNKDKHEESDHVWSPRMDVAEYKRNYILALELPGIGIKDIRVEVDDHNLTIYGKSLTHSWKAVNTSTRDRDQITTYHKKEILHGPYQVLWPLPVNANKETISAEYIDGILQITVPKL